MIKRLLMTLSVTLITLLSAQAQYILKDDDVVITNGVLESCTYNFSEKRIIIPETLDGQTITEIAGTYSFENAIFYNKGITELILPPTIEIIGINSFRENQILELIIPNSVKIINDNAFYKNLLTSVSFEENSNIQSIRRYAFASNENLSPIILPTNINEYYKYYVGDNLRFESGMSINDFYISYGIHYQYILNDDDVVVENGVIESFSYNCHIRDIVIPNILDGQIVYGIASKPHTEDGVFAKKIIYEITLPSTLKTIGDHAFRSNVLEYINFPKSLTYIGREAFAFGKLTDILLPESIDSIGSSAFYENEITNIIFGNAIKKIGSQAFLGNKLTEINIPPSLSVIEGGVFSNNNITSLFIHNNVTHIGHGAFLSNNLTTLSIPNSVLYIGPSSFERNELTEVVIPNSVTYIGYDAFTFNNISDISIGTSVSYIGEGAFYMNNSFYRITLPATKRGEYVAKTWNGYIPVNTEVIYDSNESYSADIPYILTDKDVTIKNGIIESCSYSYAKKQIQIPDTLDGQKIIGITSLYTNHEGVFSNKGIIEIILPNTMKDIGNYAFGRNKIKSLIIPESVTKIGDGAFETNYLRSVSLPSSLDSISNSLFNGNALTDIVIPKSVKYIGDYSFKSNHLKNVEIPDSVTYIGKYAFQENGLTGFTLPKSKKDGHIFRNWNDSLPANYNVKSDYFYSSYEAKFSYIVTNKDVNLEDDVITKYFNTNETYIAIPDSIDGNIVSAIGDSVFYYNPINTMGKNNENIILNQVKLLNVVLPNTITSIGNSAFENNMIDTIIFPNSVSFIGENAFFNNELISFTLPKAEKDGYILKYWNNGIASNTEVNNLSISYIANFSKETLSYSKTNLELKMYPIPSIGNIFIEGNNIKLIEIFNSHGYKIKDIHVNSNIENIDLSSYPKGIYFIKIKTEYNSTLKKILIN